MSESEPYIPKNPVVQGMLSLFNNGEHSDSADITFDKRDYMHTISYCRVVLLHLQSIVIVAKIMM